MPDVEALRQFFSVQNGVWTATALLALLIARMWNGAPAMFAQWVAYKRAKAEEKAADWQRLRDENKRIDDRCTRLEQAEERCRTELAEVQRKVSAFEGYQAGYGRASQEAAGIVAIERLGKDTRPEGDK